MTDRSKDELIGPILGHFKTSLASLDASEADVRDIVERGLTNSLDTEDKVLKGKKAAAHVAQQIMAVREPAIKDAMRHLRDNLPPVGDEDDEPKRLMVHGQSLATWAKMMIVQEHSRVHDALTTGISKNEDATDIAHRIVGSASLNGSNGATEQTRQHILRLGAGYVRRRKSRMAGSKAE